MDKPHTRKQENALHVWCRENAAICQEKGYTLNKFVHDFELSGMEIPITEELFKEIFRIAYTATTGHVSTTKASTTDYDMAYHAVVKFFAERSEPIQLTQWPDLRRGR